MTRALLRAHRAGFLAVTIIGVIAIGANVSGFTAVAGSTEAARQTFARQMQPLALQLSYMLPLPHRLDTLGGYLSWRAFPVLAVVVAVWGVLAATGAARGEEDRGVLGAWLAAGMGRVRWIAIRTVTFALVSAVSVAIVGLATLALGRGAGYDFTVASVAGQSAVLWALGFAWFGSALFLAQLVSGRGAATGLGVTVLLALFFANSLARTASSLDGLARLSPFHLYDGTDVLTPGGRFDAVGVAVLAAVGVAGALVAAAAFARRDLDAALTRGRARDRRAVRTPSSNPLLRAPVLSRLWQWKWMLLAWMVGAALLAALMVSVAHSVTDLVRGNPAMQALLGAGGTDPAIAMIAFGWFSLACLGFAMLAVVRTSAWSAEDTSGRLEMELAQPLPRWRITIERALELGIAALLVGATGSLVVVLAAPSQHIDVGLGRMAVATALLIPVALSFGALGAAIASWLPRFAVGLLAVVAAAAFFLQDLGPLFKWPDWAVNLSIFQLYGNPLISDVFWNGLWAMVAIIVVGFLVATAALRRREVGR